MLMLFFVSISSIWQSTRHVLYIFFHHVPFFFFHPCCTCLHHPGTEICFLSSSNQNISPLTNQFLRIHFCWKHTHPCCNIISLFLVCSHTRADYVPDTRGRYPVLQAVGAGLFPNPQAYDPEGGRPRGALGDTGGMINRILACFCSNEELNSGRGGESLGYIEGQEWLSPQDCTSQRLLARGCLKFITTE